MNVICAYFSFTQRFSSLHVILLTQTYYSLFLLFMKLESCIVLKLETSFNGIMINHLGLDQMVTYA